MNIINQKLECLREVMKREHLAAFIFLVLMLTKVSMWLTIGWVELGYQVLMVLRELQLLLCILLRCGQIPVIFLLLRNNCKALSFS